LKESETFNNDYIVLPKSYIQYASNSKNKDQESSLIEECCEFENTNECICDV